MIWLVMQYVIDAFCSGFAIGGTVALVVFRRVLKPQAMAPKSALEACEDRQKITKIMVKAQILNCLLFASYTGARILEWLTN